jgi:hypothetical protein
MNKESELQIFKYIYGSCSDWEIVESESPDFICMRNGHVTLGVEVTEFYFSESCARLRNIEKYTEELLDGGAYKHRDDINCLVVDKIKIIKENGDLFAETEAIKQEVPPYNELGKLVEKSILTKELKTPAYLKSCPKVDLAIFDASHTFLFQDFEDFFIPFSNTINKSLLLGSSFREIFLVTQKQSEKERYSKVIIPLKLNIFTQASTLYLDLAIEKLNIETEEYSIDLQNLFLSCLCQAGFCHLETLDIEGDFSVALGGYLYIYTKNGVVIRDYIRYPEEYPAGITISDSLKKRGVQTNNMVSEIMSKQYEFQSYAPLYFDEKQV